ncbi:NtaA/DmoA family FMN-dependent monooxygenase [Mycolicibacterium confluentis]|uniref:Dibenzothiophene desulfurization enzyme A n=1 Tax=Mycolicibacterium confluentis TaxID=28047 RepID=A0A7I7XTB3_9MYCO|nr:NtaA/DmoA family FMN-dependent monooxygenase [Mycolicibacterium confluentis]MCV7321160.1 NtaA/DmoA family FMN-dependent monooxygenase [Mycolicibacterium confluentis]ORV21246.1 FMNH2-dependent monooxygenase [Mycolicibacterium confluentis]BBZ32364.1 dibenzothiophene desulfurization enzyme A [Mycolicibacterium confluentis]
MAPKKFHLGWFVGFVANDFTGPFSPPDDPWDGKFYVEMAQSMERAGFDYMMFEDTVSVPDAYGQSFDTYLKHALWVPKHDPVPLAAVIAAATSKMGVIATMSTAFYPPYMLARTVATVDHIAKGRFGWNIVTSGQDQAARNFGMDKLLPHDKRYEVAHEYVDVVRKLWDSWDADNIVRDYETGAYIAPGTVRPIHHEGEYFRTEGPLTTVRPPNGQPVFVQAGGSPKGRDFAAKYADSIVANPGTIEEMRAFRDDVRARATAYGRDPDEIKVLFIAMPVLAATTEEAKAANLRNMSSDRAVENILAGFSFVTDIDFSQFPLDEVPPQDLTTNGEQSSLDMFLQRGSGKTLRQLAMDYISPPIELVGTPDEVADRMGEVIDEVGGDGFLIYTGSNSLNRRFIAEITEGLVPALQRRGRTRTEYKSEYLRDNLREF